MQSRSVAPLLIALALTLAAPSVLAQDRGAAAIQNLSSARWPRQRVTAAVTLGRLRPPGAREALERGLEDDSLAVRRASADGLMRLGDAAALPALERQLNHPSPQVRGACRLAYRRLSGRSEVPAAPSAPPPAAPPPAPSAPPLSTAAIIAPALLASRSVVPAAPPAPAPMPVALPAAAAPSSVAPARAVDWSRVRFVVAVGSIANQASRNPADTDYTRECLRHAIQGDPEFALNTGSLPAVANARIRSGALRSYTLEGALQSVQRQQPPGQVAVRAELSLLIIAEPVHSILGTMSTAATAQEPALISPNAPDPTPRLTRSAIEVAARGAIERLRNQFTSPRRRGRGRR